MQSEGGIFINEGLDFLKQIGIQLETFITPNSTRRAVSIAPKGQLIFRERFGALLP
jgi:hypothetical protein